MALNSTSSFPRLSGVQVRSRGRGFTLIELMLTIVLIGLVAAIAVPGFQSLIESNRLKSGTNGVVGVLNYARSEALKQGVSVDVAARVNGDWKQGLQASAGGDTLRVSEPLGGDLQVTGSDVSFLGNGMADGSATFRICIEGDRGREIVVNQGGQVRTEEVDCS